MGEGVLYKVAVVTSTVTNITFVVNETTFKVALITSSVVNIIFVVSEIIFFLANISFLVTDQEHLCGDWDTF